MGLGEISDRGRSKDEWNAFQLASATGSMEVVQMLIKQGANINVQRKVCEDLHHDCAAWVVHSIHDARPGF